jgi:cyclic pyranopterin phosphate synthase
MERNALSELTHLDKTGAAHMVDVSQKQDTHRMARAQAVLRVTPRTAEAIRSGDLPKGDVLAAARIAGIMAAKRTSDLIPLCHPICITKASVDITVEETDVRIEARVECVGATGVEMEALTAASVSALALYDMVKAVQRDAVITDVRLLEKQGGRSGHYVAE